MAGIGSIPLDGCSAGRAGCRVPAGQRDCEGGEKLEKGAADHGDADLGMADGRSAVDKRARRSGFRQTVQMGGDGESGP